MAGIKFKGEVDSLTSIQKRLIIEVLQKRHLNAVTVTIETLGKAGDNFAANVKKIIAELKNGETFNMIAKVSPNIEMLRATSGIETIFANECLMYQEILPKFVDLQHAAGISPNEIFRFAECYGSSMEPLNEMILLEDLKESNFEMFDRFKPLPNEHLKTFLKNLASLHSLSFVIQKHDPDLFQSYIEKLNDFRHMMSVNPYFQGFFVSLENDTISILDKEKHKNAVVGITSKVAELCEDIKEYERGSKYNVIIHGDAWTNNIMFRTGDNIPVDAIMIDYQMGKVGSPANDLLYMIFNCTDFNTRHKYYYEWIDYYYTELEKNLSYFKMKVKDTYPRDKLDEDLHRCSKLYFTVVIISHSFLIRKNKDAAKMKETMESTAAGIDQLEELTEAMKISILDTESIAVFKTKTEELIDSYHEFGYLN